MTQEELKQLLHYDPDTGDFTWRLTQGRKIAGDKAGSVNCGNGYRYIGVMYKVYLAHRLAWFYTYGLWPIGDIDHINHDKLDNHITNLRDVCKSMNSQNTVGLGYTENANRYQALIQYDGASHYLGRYKTKEEAHNVYMKAKREHHEGFIEQT